MKEINLIESLAKAQSEMTHAHFDQTNPHFKSKFASLKSVIDAVKPALNKNGIFLLQVSHPVETGVGIETIFCKGDEKLSTGIVVAPVDKANAQGLGSALTYAKRYSLAMATSISADSDDDGNAAAANPPKNSTGRKPQSVTRQVIEQEGIVVDEEKKNGYVTGLVEAINSDDNDGLKELLAELKSDSDMKIAVWAELPSAVRAFIRKQEK